MEYDFNLLCYGLFKIPKIVIILEAFLSIEKNYLKNIFLWFFNMFIASWFEIGN